MFSLEEIVAESSSPTTLNDIPLRLAREAAMTDDALRLATHRAAARACQQSAQQATPAVNWRALCEAIADADSADLWRVVSIIRQAVNAQRRRDAEVTAE